MNFKKTVAFFTALCLVITLLPANIFASVKEREVINADALKIQTLIPADYGKIVYESDNKSNLLVVNIQDLHSNYFVQKNITNILEALDKNYDISNVFIEGGYDNINLAWLKNIKDESFRNKLSEKLFVSGRLTGAEYFAYISGRENFLKGLEDKNIHKDNLKRLSDLISKQKTFDSELQKIKSDIDFLSNSVFSRDNRKLAKILDKFHNGSLSTEEYYLRLFKLLDKTAEYPERYNGILPLTASSFKTINTYLYISQMQMPDNKALVKDAKAFVSMLKAKLPYNEYQTLETETSKFTDSKKIPAAFNNIAVNYGINLSKDYPVLNKFITGNMIAATINPMELIAEDRILINSLRQAFSRNQTEYEISFLSDFYTVFKDYMSTNLTAANYQYFISKNKKFAEIYSKYATVNRLKNLTPYFAELNKYYEINNARNSIFANKILNNRDLRYGGANQGKNIFERSKDIVVVISGGFHSKGLQELFKDKNISFVTISPAIENIQNTEKTYRNMIKEEVSIDANALSFTVASSVSDFLKFNMAVNAGLEILGGAYSKETIDTVTDKLKSMVTDDVTVEFSQDKTTINVGTRKIILTNDSGAIKNTTTEEDFDEYSQAEINSSYINSLFENNPELNFSDGLIFELRNAENNNILSIKGIDLSVIARLPELIQQYLYESLPQTVKNKMNPPNPPAVLITDNNIVKKIKNIRSPFLRRLSYKIYSIIIAPIIEAPLLNRIYETAKTDPKKSQKMISDMLKQHEGFNKNTKTRYESGIKKILDGMDRTNVFFTKNKVLAFASGFSVSLSNVVIHGTWNKHELERAHGKKILTFRERITKAITILFILITIPSIVLSLPGVSDIFNNLSSIPIVSTVLTGIDASSYIDITKNSELRQTQVVEIMERIQNLDSAKTNQYYGELINLQKDLTSEEYMASMVDGNYIKWWKEQLAVVEDQIADGLPIIESDTDLTTMFGTAYTEKEHGFLKILSLRNNNEALLKIINDLTQPRDYRYYAHMVLMASGTYTPKEGEFDELFNRQETLDWVGQESTEDKTDFDAKVESYIMNYLYEANVSAKDILRNSRLVLSGGTNVAARSDLSYSSPVGSLSALAAHELGHRRLFNMLGSKSSYLLSGIGELYAYSVQYTLSLELDVPVHNVSPKSISEMMDQTEVHDAGHMVIDSIQTNFGNEYMPLLSRSVEEYQMSLESDPEISMRETVLNIVNIFADKVIAQEIQNNTLTTSRAERKKEIVIQLMNYENYFGDFIEPYLDDPQIKEINDYFISNLKGTDTEYEFFNRLLTIRGELNKPDSHFTPTTEEQSSYVMWKYMLEGLDTTIVNSEATIDKLNLSAKYHSVYTDEQITYIKITEMKNEETKDSLVSVINNENLDMKYRFYAYMLALKRFNTDDSIAPLIDKKTIVEYLSDYKDSSDFSSTLSGIYNWQTLCGMVSFVSGNTFDSYSIGNLLFKPMILSGEVNPENTEYVSNIYVYNYVKEYLKDITSNPVIYAAVANDLNSLADIKIFMLNTREEFTGMFVNMSILKISHIISTDTALPAVTVINQNSTAAEIGTALSSKIYSVDGKEGLEILKQAVKNQILSSDQTMTMNRNMLYGVLTIFENKIKDTDVKNIDVAQVLQQSIDEYIQKNDFTRCNLPVKDMASAYFISDYLDQADQLFTEQSRRETLEGFIAYVNASIQSGGFSYKDSAELDAALTASADAYSTFNIENSKAETVKGIIHQYAVITADAEIAAGTLQPDQKDARIEEIETSITPTFRFTIDNKIVSKIKNIKNKKIRTLLYNAYSVIIAPVSEAPLLNAIYRAGLTDVKKSEALKEDFFKKHAGFNKTTRIDYEAIMEQMLGKINRTYKFTLRLTHSAKIAEITSTITNVLVHKKWNKKQIKLEKKRIRAKTPRLVRWAKKLAVTAALLIGLSVGALAIISPSDFVSTCQSTAYTITAVDHSSTTGYYSSLLEIRKNLGSEDFMPDIMDIYYTPVWKYQVHDVEDKIADGLDTIMKNETLKKDLESVYSQRDIGYLKILSVRKEPTELIKIINDVSQDRDYRYFAHMILIAEGDYTPKDGEFAALFDRQATLEWIKSENERGQIATDFEWQVENYIMNFIVDANVPADFIQKWSRMILSGDTYIVARADLSYSADKNANLSSTSAHEIGHDRLYLILSEEKNPFTDNTYYNLITGLVKSYLTKMSVHELYAYSSQTVMEFEAGLDIETGSSQAMAEIGDGTEEHDAGSLVLESVKTSMGPEYAEFLKQAIEEYQSDANFENKATREVVYEITALFSQKVADSELAAGKITASSKQTREQEIVSKIMNYQNFFGQYIDSYLGQPQVKLLHDRVGMYLKDVKTEQQFVEALLKIRTEMVNPKSDISPEIADSSYYSIWRYVLKDLDTILAGNAKEITGQQYTDAFAKAYTQNEFEYVKMASLPYTLTSSMELGNKQQLINIVKGDKDLKYRFYAYMMLIDKNSDDTKLLRLMNKAEVEEYLREYNYSEYDFTNIHNIYEWRTLCAMVNFISTDTFDSNAAGDLLLEPTIFKDTQSVTTGNIYAYNVVAGRFKDLTSNPVLLAAIANDLNSVYETQSYMGTKSSFIDLYGTISALRMAETLSIPIEGLPSVKLTDISNKSSYLEMAAALNGRISQISGEEGLKTLDTAAKNYISETDQKMTFRRNMLFGVMNIFDAKIKALNNTPANIEEIMDESIEEYINGNNFTSCKLPIRDMAQAYFISSYLSEASKLFTDTEIRQYLNEFSDFIEKEYSHSSATDADALISSLTSKIETYTTFSPQENKNEVVKGIVEQYASILAGKKNVAEDEKPVFVQATTNDILNYASTENTYSLSNFKLIAPFDMIVIFASMIMGIFIYNGNKNNSPHKIGIFYKQITSDEISDAEQTQLSKDLFANVFVITGKMPAEKILEFNFKPSGLKINGQILYTAVTAKGIYLYCENSDYGQTVNDTKNSEVLNSQIAEFISKAYGVNIKSEKTQFIFAQVVNAEKESVSWDNEIFTIKMPLLNAASGFERQQEIMGSYMNVLKKYAFALRESIYRYVDDLSIETSKEDRMKEFLDLIEQQKNISCQIVLGYAQYIKLAEDFGQEKFNSVLEEARTKNINVYILTASDAEKEEALKNDNLCGTIEVVTKDSCVITDKFTNDEITAAFDESSDTVEKIISAMTKNINKQPIIFKNSLLKKAVADEQDSVLSGDLRNIFSMTKVTEIISTLKSKYLSAKIAEAYPTESLAKNFGSEDISKIIALYTKAVTTKDYSQVIQALTAHQDLSAFFDFKKLVNDSRISDEDISFIEQIVFRIAAAGKLAEYGKEIGLKNRGYENILAKAMKMKVIDFASADNNNIDENVKAIDKIQDQLSKEQMMRKYIEENVDSLVQRAFSKSKPDVIAVNTLIFLMPFADTNDIQVDVASLALAQQDISITRNILSAA